MIHLLLAVSVLLPPCEPCPDAPPPPEATISDGQLVFSEFSVWGSASRHDQLRPGGTHYAAYQEAKALDVRRLTRRPAVIRFEQPRTVRDVVAGPEHSTVLVEALLDSEGDVRAVTVVEASHCLMVTPSLEAVVDMKFSPAEIDGTPVWCLVRIPFRYEFGDQKRRPGD